MEQYTILSKYYDSLLDASMYGRYAGKIDALFKKSRLKPQLVLELACGTGSLTRALSALGYEMIACDSSPEMLAIARNKCQTLNPAPVFLQQDMLLLDLYGTVDAAVCCLDSINYILTFKELKKVFSNVALFLNDDGLFVFDVKTPHEFARLGGTASVFETAHAFCAWQYGFERKSGLAEHRVDIFAPSGNLFKRLHELHYQRAYPLERITEALKGVGFADIGVYDGYSNKKATQSCARWLFKARRAPRK